MANLKELIYKICNFNGIRFNRNPAPIFLPSCIRLMCFWALPPQLRFRPCYKGCKYGSTIRSVVLIKRAPRYLRSYINMDGCDPGIKSEGEG